MGVGGPVKLVDETGRSDSVGEVVGWMVALMLWWPKCMEICLFRGGLSSKIAPAAPCFCFLNRGPGPSEAASEGQVTERSKTLGPGIMARAEQREQRGVLPERLLKLRAAEDLCDPR